MMGINKEQKDLFSYCVDLDRRVRADNPLRLIRQAVDFDWVREEVAEFYGYNGNVSVDPVIIVKLLLLLFLDNIKSERELMRTLPERLDYLWFLGLGLDDEIPNHSVLSKARARWGEAVFEKLFTRIVAQCVMAGLVDGSKVHVDSSLIVANASAHKNIVTASEELIHALREAYQVEDKKIYQPERRSNYKSKNKTMLSKTDPDAPIVSRGSGSGRVQPRPRYKSHRVVDDHCGVITAVETTGADIHDGACLVGLVRDHDHNAGVRANTIIGDRHYGTRHNFKTLCGEGRRTHMATYHATGQAATKGVFPASRFRYDPDTDTFVCPAGERLTRRSFNKKEGGWNYRAGKKICDKCPLKEQCYQSKSPGYTRTVLLPEGHELIEEGYRMSETREARRDRHRRMSLIEGSFGQASQNHGFKRSRWRRLGRQSIQDYLIATVQNIKKLIKNQRKGPYADLRSAGACIIDIRRKMEECVGDIVVFVYYLTRPAPSLVFDQTDLL